ncbi:MAG TPA: radical SAM family heme chaperone HemW [Candidatus Omnitrophota bacterium]|jgi:oxygen-independent coproporphyrinogen-3 oxidase|nr:radical SAM family heme chaperone HemW [Candidatus Omnitrophota bacterium]
MKKGLYIHIPFCKSRCHYCHFISIADPGPDVRRRFFNCLFRELDHARAEHGAIKFDTIYFGGGTPSLLTEDEMTEIVNRIRAAFGVRPGAEITCEWNPGDGDEEKLRAFSALGANRISLGAQSFRDDILQRLGRRHTAHDTIVTLDRIRGAGITNVSLDLMLRLPGQTVVDFRDSLCRAVGLGVSQVSLYDLEIHEETVFGRMQREQKLDLPAEQVHAAMYEAAIRTLTGAGYEHYEISNFARPGFASRHNLIYWRNEEYLGLGPGSFSYLAGVRSGFAHDLEGYFRKCETGEWTNDVEDVLSEEDKETESFTMRLRLCGGAAPSRFPVLYERIKDRARELLDGGFLEWAGDSLRLTTRGKFLSEDVFGFLLRKE